MGIWDAALSKAPSTSTMADMGVSSIALPFELAGNFIPGKMDKENKAQIAYLKRLQADHQLGLTDAERATKDRDLMSPVRAAASAGETAARRDMAATGLTTGAALAKTQQDSAQMIGAAGMSAKKYLDQLDTQKARAQQEELSAREANQAARRADRWNNAAGMVKEAAGVAGKTAGAPPEQTKMYGLFGAPATDPTAALKNIPASATDADRSYVADVVSRSGDNLDKVMKATEAGKTTDPNYDAQLASILARWRSLSTLDSYGLSGAPASPTPTAGNMTQLPASTLYDNPMA